jgi:hypothetical protein
MANNKIVTSLMENLPSMTIQLVGTLVIVGIAYGRMQSDIGSHTKGLADVIDTVGKVDVQRKTDLASTSADIRNLQTSINNQELAIREATRLAEAAKALATAQAAAQATDHDNVVRMQEAFKRNEEKLDDIKLDVKRILEAKRTN